MIVRPETADERYLHLILPVMKKTSSFLFALLFVLTAIAQQEDLYYLDKGFKGTGDPKDAAYLLRIVNHKDTLWQYDTYRLLGPLLSSEFFKDKDATIAHGRFRYYKANGFLDSIAEYKNNLKQGSSFYYNDTGAVYQELVYEKGILKEKVDNIKKRKEQEQQDSTTSSKEVTFTKVEVESEFPGGRQGWAGYLTKTLKYPERAINNNIGGTVVIQFIVDKEGSVDAIEIYRSVEYSLDQAALHIIRKSPKWNPAIQFGRKVKSYKRQPIVFRLN